VKSLSAALAAYESAELMDWIDLGDAQSDHSSSVHGDSNRGESGEETVLSV